MANLVTYGEEWESRRKVPTDKKVMNSILENIGKTPLVRLNRIPQLEGVECDIFAKCEFFNAGGSVKDRIGLQMISDAEESGRIKKGDTLIEPTSGNTGIGLALAAAIKGYRMIITLPEKMSQEKVDVLKALGADIIRTPTEAAWDSPESHFGVAKRLNMEIPNSHILDQYSNPGNPGAHYNFTAEEIWEQCDGKIDMMVVSAGTGGTISGIAKKLKEKDPSIKIVGVDPVGSILAVPDSLNDEDRLKPYKVEGIGYDFIPDVLDRSLVDSWIKTKDAESFNMARRLIREEGLLCGGSCGSAVVGAVKAAKELKAGQRCVVLLADSVRNYMSKFLNDRWMEENGYVEIKSSRGLKEWWSMKTVKDLCPSVPFSISSDVPIKSAVKILVEKGYDQLPVVDESGDILGVVTAGNMNAKLLANTVAPEDSVLKVLFPQFRKVEPNTPLWSLARIFDKDHFALVTQQQTCYLANGETKEKSLIVGVVTRIDLLKYVTEGEQK